MCSVLGTSKCRCNGDRKAKSTNYITGHSIVRKLFSDHSWFVQDYVQSVIFKLPTAAALRVRLLDNQTEIGMELGKFDKVGPKNGKAVGGLLTAHIALAEKVVVAAIGGNSSELKQATTNLFEQGDSMSDTLAKVLSLPAKVVRAEFRMHNQHVINMATLLLTKKYGSEYVMELDMFLNHMLKLADTIYMAAAPEEDDLESGSSSSDE